jgi:hypothetical protein
VNPTGIRLSAAFAGLLLAAPAAPGAAVEPSPTLTLDGGSRAVAVDRPLWDADTRWVPGDERSVDLWLRNDSTARATVALAVRVDGSGRDRVLGDALRVRLTVDDVSQTLGAAPVPLPALDAGTRRRVRLTAALPASATDATQNRRVTVRLLLTPLDHPTRRGPR